MDERIVIKEIDKLISIISKQRVITEYIIYYMRGNVKAEAYTEIGDEAKKIRVNELLLKYFVTENDICWGHREYPIEEISFNEVYNIKIKNKDGNTK